MDQTTGGQPAKTNVWRREAAYLRRVSTLERKGLYDEAVQALEKAMALVPDKASHCVKLAELYRAQRKMREAIKAVKRAIELDPVNPSAQEWLLQMYLETGQLDEAIRESKRLIKRRPHNLFARDVLGAAYLQQGLVDKALLVTSELVRLNPTDAANHFKKAVLYQQKGDIARSVEEFMRVVEMDPDSEMADAALEAVMALDAYQLRQIATLAAEDALFHAKLLRDPERAVAERGFVLSMLGLLTLKQIDFLTLPSQGQDPQRYYH